MKKVLLSLVFVLSSIVMYAQNDVINFHNGKKAEGTVVRINEYTITYKYVGEDAENVVSKYAVEKIVYKSGRTEEITEKIVVNGPDDWKKVIVVDDKNMMAGLTRVGEVTGKTSFFNVRTSNGNDKRALEKLKQEAAKMSCPFVLFTSENKAVGSSSGNTLGGTQVAKKGIGYKY